MVINAAFLLLDVIYMYSSILSKQHIELMRKRKADMNKKIIILSIGLAYAFNSGNSFAVQVSGDSLNIQSNNGDNNAQDYVSTTSTSSYLTQNAVTTDGYQTYENNSLIQQGSDTTSSYLQTRAKRFDIVNGQITGNNGSELNQVVNSTESTTSISSRWSDTNGFSSLYQQNNSSSSMMNSDSNFDTNSYTYVNQVSNSINAHIAMTASSNGATSSLDIDSALGIQIGGALSVSGSTATNGITNTGSISTSSLTTSGNTSVGGDLSVTGNTTINGNLTIGGTTTFTGASTFANGLTVSGSVASFQSGASVSGGDLNMNSNRITNVAAGVSGTDAVNLNQLNAVSGQINDMSQKSYAGTASVAAIAGIPALQSDKNFNVGLGYGNFRGEDAIAIGGNARLTDTVSLKAAFASSRSEVTSSFGVGIAF
jgi:hypothetical protein